MKPGISKWATNTTYAAGPDVGQPTKAELSSGLVADGYYRNRAVAPDFWNMHRWRLCEIVDNVAKGKLKNYLPKVVDTPTWTYGLVPGPVIGTAGTIIPRTSAAGTRWDEYLYAPCGTTNAVGAGQDLLSSVGGEIWVSTSPGTAPARWIPYDAAGASLSGAGGGGGFAGVDAGGAIGGLWYLARGSAGPIALWSATVLYHGIDTSGPETGTDVWCAYETTTPMVQRAATLGAAVAPVLGLGALVGGTLGCIKHSHHGANKLYPGDPGNDCWMLVTNGGVGEVATSFDNGANWTIVSAAGPFVSSHRCLAYSAWGTRWGMIDFTAAMPRFAYSDDNGVSWTSVVDSFAFTARAYNSVDPVCQRLACDGFGHWVAAFITGRNLGNVELDMYVSGDNGLTWSQSYVPHTIPLAAANASYGIDLFYGDGAFWLIVCYDNPVPNPLYQVFSTVKSWE